MTTGLTNWAGNVAFTARRAHRPASVPELQRLVAGARRVRAVGTAHSFNTIADTAGDLVSVAGLPATIEISDTRASVTVAAGIRYGELAKHLHANGLAVPNLASLPHLSVAGACATATHGSGDHNGNLATAVSTMDFVSGSGELVTVSRATDRFAGAVVALGSLGIVTSLALDVVPSFDIRQYVYDDLPFDEFTEHWAEIFASGYSVSLFTDWTGPRFTQVWRKERVCGPDSPPPTHWMGATLATTARHPITGMSAVNCTDQLGVPGPWHTRLPHFRLEFTPSSGQELQSEYLIPREHTVAALAALFAIRAQIAPVLQISELRTVAADDLWLSPSYRRDSLAIHFTWVDRAAVVAPVVAAVEEQLAPFGARPHWGKLFSTDPTVLSGLYERHADFRDLCHDYDPAGKFRNDLIDRYFPPTPPQPRRS